MKSKSIIVLLTTFLVTGTVVARPDWGNDHHPEPGPGRIHSRMMGPNGGGCNMPMPGTCSKRHKSAGIHSVLRYADELDLSDSQKKQLEDIQFEFQMARIDQEAAVKKAKVKLMHLKRNDEVAEAEVMKAIDNVAGAKAEMKKMQYSHRRKILASLTDEQREKLHELRMEQRCGPDGEEINVEVEKIIR